MLSIQRTQAGIAICFFDAVAHNSAIGDIKLRHQEIRNGQRTK